MVQQKAGLKKKELRLILRLEKEELRQFNRLVSETLLDVEKTKKELKVEERINLNLHFINYKLSQIHSDIAKLILTTKTERTRKGTLEARHRIKSLLRHIVELDRDFLPAVKKNLAILSKSEQKKFKLAANIQHEFTSYKQVVDKLKLIFDIAQLSSKDIRSLEHIELESIYPKIG